MSRRRLLLYSVPVILLAIAILLSFHHPSTSPNEENRTLRLLSWAGYDEPEIIQPFEKETGVKVLTENFTSGDNMFTKVTKSPEAWDLVVIDPEYISKLHSADLISELNPKDFDFSHYAEPLKHFPLCWIDGKLYATLVRFGVNGIVYNRQKLSAQDVSSYDVLWSPKLKGKVGLWDWYLPNMGILSLSKGFNPPYKLDESQFSALRQHLDSLRPQVNAVFGSFSDINSAFARGDIWIAPALGEHTAAILSEQGYPIDWTIPKEGAIMWIETVGILKKATNRQDAVRFIQYLQRPEVQAKLTWRKAYRSNIPNTAAISLLTPQQQNALKVHNPEEANALVRSLHVRNLPTNERGATTESTWQSAWQDFKSSLGNH